MVKGDGSEESEVIEFTWDILDFDEDFIKLQISYKNPEKIGQFYSRDYISVVFWNINFFRSYQGIEVEMGTELTWQIER